MSRYQNSIFVVETGFEQISENVSLPDSQQTIIRGASRKARSSSLGAQRGNRAAIKGWRFRASQNGWGRVKTDELTEFFFNWWYDQIYKPLGGDGSLIIFRQLFTRVYRLPSPCKGAFLALQL